MPGEGQADMADPLVWYAFAAAMTERLRFTTGILVLPQRNPLVVAKQAATLDRLSGGRFSLGVGIGWLRENSTHSVCRSITEANVTTTTWAPFVLCGASPWPPTRARTSPSTMRV